MSTRLLLTTALLFVVGCAGIPRPHRANLTPHVSGTLVADAAHAAAIPVRVCEADAQTCCTGRSNDALTAANGSFEVLPKTEFRFLMYLMAHKTFHWCLSFAVDGQWHTVGPYRDYTLFDSGPLRKYEFRCVLRDGALGCSDPMQLWRQH